MADTHDQLPYSPPATLVLTPEEQKQALWKEIRQAVCRQPLSPVDRCYYLNRLDSLGLTAEESVQRAILNEAKLVAQLHAEYSR